ncbi:hypothetical protein DIU31_016375 [Mucilaginibacter rubeus]|uniref:Uncharacterized protein n=1 Tax=Mucilaginibacter rubeus TaxID=2027860 RepID=A0AAE6MIP6_9SPHI|nr:MULTISPECIES: hypothetical protein [Mucilaginibacter]QEM05015.1 hypothetical protein DIU31_016375 [Mucilaginibacter rubeus]QEM17609.1 hypothetical protein DIU38_016540 [Mucilaginibacter gossypii]QTE45870.1 hypothetical protein J3L19_11145 [Mucilaginibacter rubeus]QTE52467.1 hypothetical protein J3L21_11115 [Mucilaginibacter rubeus]QTE57556.1 hypothetical protein J3L23_02790 [Mucilaginibacter rubeus]
MENLFASKNIQIVPIVDMYESELYFAYTPKLLQLNVFVEFFGVSKNDDDEVPEEVGVFANYYENGEVYTYVIFSSPELLGPLPVFRIIVDAVEFIENSNSHSVKELLKEIATSSEKIDKSHPNNKYYQNALFKYNAAEQLINHLD